MEHFQGKRDSSLRIYAEKFPQNLVLHSAAKGHEVLGPGATGAHLSLSWCCLLKAAGYDCERSEML